MFNWPPTLIAKCFSIPASSLHWLQVFWRILPQVYFHAYKWKLILLFSLVMSPDSVGHSVLFPYSDSPFGSSQARVICESPLCAAHISYIINKDTKSQCFWHKECCCGFFLPNDSDVLPSAFPYASFAFQFRFLFLLEPWCCPLYLFSIFPITLFFRGWVFLVVFHVFWAYYLQLYFSKIKLEAMFWITESTSQLFQRAVPWNPFKILIEFQFDETVKSIKFSAPALSTTQPFSSYPT